MIPINIGCNSALSTCAILFSWRPGSLAQEAKSSSPASPQSSSQASPSASPAAAFEEEDDKKDCKKRVVQVLRLWCVQCDRLVDDDSASNLCLDNHNLCTITVSAMLVAAW